MTEARTAATHFTQDSTTSPPAGPGGWVAGRAGAAAGALLALGALAAAASPAEAASSIVSVDFGQPKAEIATTISVRTISDVDPAGVYVKVRAAGGPACAPTPFDDPSDYLFGSSTGGRPVGAGDVTSTRVQTFTAAGTFQFCAWLRANSEIIATTTGTFTVASPVGAITGVSAPKPARPGQAFVVTVAGQSEVGRRLYAAWRPASQPACAASPSLDPDGSSSVSSEASNRADVFGAFSVQVPLTIQTPGRYRFCSWIAASRSDLNPIGVNETILTVTPPPRTTIRVAAGPKSARRARHFNVSAFVSSNAGAPAGKCAFDRRVRGRWQPYTTVRFSAGQACRARVVAGELGRTVFRVRYIPSNGFPSQVGFSDIVVVRP